MTSQRSTSSFGDALMYFFCVAVWGTTYYANRWQIGFAPTEISLLFRLVIAAVLFGMLSMRRRTSRSLNVRDHICLAGFGLCNFCLAYFFLYRATELLVSALVVIAFSTKAIWTPMATRAFLQRPLRPIVMVCGLIGICGIALIVWPGGTGPSISLTGVCLALVGTLMTSLGDVFSSRNSRVGIEPILANLWGMIYGAAGVGVLVVLRGKSLVFPASPEYWVSVLWLSVAASLIAWTFYLRLVARIGAETASMMVLLFPVASITASALFEDLAISPRLLVGASLVVGANVFALMPPNLLSRLAAAVGRRGPMFSAARGALGE